MWLLLNVMIKLLASTVNDDDHYDEDNDDEEDADDDDEDDLHWPSENIQIYEQKVNP